MLLREISDLGLGKLDVGNIVRRDLGDGSGYLFGAQLEVLGSIAVEFLRQFAHGGVAAPFNISEEFLDCLAHLSIRFGHISGTFSAF